MSNGMNRNFDQFMGGQHQFDMPQYNPSGPTSGGGLDMSMFSGGPTGALIGGGFNLAGGLASWLGNRGAAKRANQAIGDIKAPNLGTGEDIIAKMVQGIWGGQFRKNVDDFAARHNVDQPRAGLFAANKAADLESLVSPAILKAFRFQNAQNELMAQMERARLRVGMAG